MATSMKLQISYFKDTDTLSIWNGEPASEADDVAKGQLIDLNAAGSPVELALEHAAELCLPELFGPTDSPEFNSDCSSGSHLLPNEILDRREDKQLHIDYLQQSDTLWLGNGLPIPSREVIAEFITAFFDYDRPNAVMTERAAEILLPILQAATKVKEKTAELPEEPAKASS